MTAISMKHRKCHINTGLESPFSDEVRWRIPWYSFELGITKTEHTVPKKYALPNNGNVVC